MASVKLCAEFREKQHQLLHDSDKVEMYIEESLKNHPDARLNIVESLALLNKLKLILHRQALRQEVDSKYNWLLRI